MSKIVLKPFRSEGAYDGVFAKPAFPLLTNPSRLYETLLNRLGRFGASLDALRFDASSVSDANVSCSILALNLLVRVKLDRIQVSFFRLDEIGEATAKHLLEETVHAVLEAEPAVALARHTVAVTVNARAIDSSASAVIGRFVKVPEAFDGVSSGVAFYFRADNATGRESASIILDRLGEADKDLTLKVIVSFDANRVPIGGVASTATSFLSQHLDYLGLDLLRQAAKG